MAGLDIIDARYMALWERAKEVLDADDRVRCVELSGSVGLGTADRWSALDLQIIVEPEDHAAFLAEWPQWLDAITPTVFARTPVAPFIINAITDQGLTLDLAIWPGEAIEFPAATDYAVGMLSTTRFPDVSSALEYAVLEQLRSLAGPFISLVQRDEHLRHLTGVPHLLGLLTTVFLAEIGAPPPAKHWNRTFTEEQRSAVAALPSVSATREGLVAFGLGVAELVVTRSRPLYPQHSLEWPAALARVAATRIQAELGVDTTSWLH